MTRGKPGRNIPLPPNPHFSIYQCSRLPCGTNKSVICNRRSKVFSAFCGSNFYLSRLSLLHSHSSRGLKSVAFLCTLSYHTLFRKKQYYLISKRKRQNERVWGKNGQKKHFWHYSEIVHGKRKCRKARRMRDHTA